MKTLLVSTKIYTFNDFRPLYLGPTKVSLSRESEKNIKRSHRYLFDNLDTDKTIYGVNTGFGNLSHIQIDSSDIDKLQVNLIRSHASGVGSPLHPGIVRAYVFETTNFRKRL